MATLYIAEFPGMAHPGRAQVAAGPPIAEQTVAIAGASAQSSAFNDATRVIRIHTDATCSFLIGGNPTATAVKSRLAADQTEYFAVQPGHKIAVISNS